MSRCQMQQFDMEETFWEDSRRMATFIYNRVPPARCTPGKPWLSPAQQQYPDRPYMDMSRIQPFGLKCFVHQVNEKRNKGYSGKSDKKQNAVEGKVVGYDDLQGSLRVKSTTLQLLTPNGLMNNWLNMRTHWTNWRTRTSLYLLRMYQRGS